MTSREKAAALRGEIDAAVKAHFGDRASVGNAKFDEMSVTFQVKVNFASGEDAKAALRKMFQKLAPGYGLLPSDFDLPISIRGEAAELVAIEIQKVKPFVFQARRGRYVASADTFLAARARAAAGKAA